MDLLAVVKEARGLISEEDHWIQGTLAQSPDGKPVFTFSKNAVCFCAWGAVLRAYSNQTQQPMDTKAEKAFADLLGRDLTAFNDTTSHAQVLHRFDVAIASLEQ